MQPLRNRQYMIYLGKKQKGCSFKFHQTATLIFTRRPWNFTASPPQSTSLYSTSNHLTPFYISPYFVCTCLTLLRVLTGRIFISTSDSLCLPAIFIAFSTARQPYRRLMTSSCRSHGGVHCRGTNILWYSMGKDRGPSAV